MVRQCGGTGHCIQCAGDSDGYSWTFLVIDSNTTICAYIGWVSSSYTCYVGHEYYQDESYYDKDFIMPSIEWVCVNCETFYATSNGVNLCGDGCAGVGSDLDYLGRSINLYSMGCSQCSQEDFQMQKFMSVPSTWIYVKTCEANINGVYCDSTQYYDSDLNACVSCNEKFTNCAACNATNCLVCATGMKLSKDYYDYATQSTIMRDTCYLEGCPAYKGGLYDGAFFTCLPCNIEGCYTCYIQYFVSTGYIYHCTGCEAGYKLQDEKCIEKEIKIERNYFVSSGASYTENMKDLDIYISNKGMAPSSPFYFLQAALYQIFLTDSVTYDRVDATIWIGKGDHFFFFCEKEIINGFTSLTEYCKDLDDDGNYGLYYKLLKYKPNSDNLNIVVRPLECSRASELGYKDDTDFQSMCISKLTDKTKPVIYVNQAYAYFEIFGFWTFRNLRFTGINALSKPIVSSKSISTLPIQLCEIQNEPTGPGSSLNLKKTKLDSFPISYVCINSWYNSSIIPNTETTNRTCERNDGDIFYSEKESTLTSTGEPIHRDYFYTDDDTDYGQIDPKKRHTLFNLNTFSDVKRSRDGPVALKIINCEFEYFLANYDSLVNVNNNEFTFETERQGYYGEDSQYHYSTWKFYVSHQGEGGAQISIQNSKFKHSNFKKGLINYRKQPYITENLFFANYTYLEMLNPLVQDAGSYIILDSSSFFNLNYLTNVTALAIYGGSNPKQTVTSESKLQADLEYQAFINKGIVLNLEDFGGFVQIKNCNFTANMHFIPEMLITNYSKLMERSVETFKESSITKEYKMTICDIDNFEDQYFFQRGVSSDDDIDTYYDKFERLSLIYISRNRDRIILKDNKFHQNAGTFGGAVSINSPNFVSSKSAFIIITNNTFTKNMAYFSGNAIYIRLTKKSSNMDNFCGGITITSNQFKNNFGMKTHNGGAISIYCHFISTLIHDDFFATSSYGYEFGEELGSSLNIQDGIDLSIKYKIYPYKVQIESNFFQENFSGQKGTALYLRQVSYVWISNCTFLENGPVFSQLETLYSPYYNYLSSRPITYFNKDSNCPTEFGFMAHCGGSNSIIDWYNIKGAVYIEHCEELDCIQSENVMEVLIDKTIFQNNQAGPIVSTQIINDFSSQLYIVGGFQNQIQYTTFKDNSGLYLNYFQHRAQPLIDFYNIDYFEQHFTPLIFISINPDAELSLKKRTFNTTFYFCNFKRNYHVQVAGLTESQQYWGSLIAYTSYYGESTTNFIPLINILETIIEENTFVGPYASLIYIYNGIVKFMNNKAKNNGVLYSVVQEGDPLKLGLDAHTFKSYSMPVASNFGVLRIEGLKQIKSIYHHLASNTFAYTFAEFGAAYYLELEGQSALIENNIYNYNFASKEGSVMNVFKQLEYSKYFDLEFEVTEFLCN